MEPARTRLPKCQLRLMTLAQMTLAQMTLP